MTTKARRVKKVKPVKAWAIQHPDGYLISNSVQGTRRATKLAWIVGEPWEAWALSGYRIVRVEIRVIGRNT